MEIHLLENQNIKRLQKHLVKHCLIVMFLLFLIVTDFLIGFLFQSRETQTIFIIGCSFVLWACLSLILFMLFVFISPERKYLKVLLNAQNRPMTTLKGVVINELPGSYEDGFRVKKYEFQVDESKSIVVKIEASQVPNLEINKRYLLKVATHFVVGYEEIL